MDKITKIILLCSSMLAYGTSCASNLDSGTNLFGGLFHVSHFGSYWGKV